MTCFDVVFDQSNEKRNGAASCNQMPVTVDQSQKANTIFDGGFLLSAKTYGNLWHGIGQIWVGQIVSRYEGSRHSPVQAERSDRLLS
jgi:hypothetical protein